MREEEIIVDLDDPVFTKTIRSRQNDKNGLKLIVYLKQKGRSVDLTGYAIKYEATNHTGAFIRDDAQLIDAKNGVFSYAFTPQSVSTASDWTAYFVFEKSTERMSTPDIRIVLRRDVKEGNIKIENYISDFEKAIEQVAGYQKDIDDTNKRIIDTNNKFAELTTLINAKNVQVPKITTDAGGVTISVSDASKNILDEIVANSPGMNTIYCNGGVQGQTPNNKSWRGISFLNSATYGFVIAKDYQNKLFTNYLDNGKWLGWVEHSDATKVVSKSGDTMKGDLKTEGTAMFDSLGAGIIQGGGNNAVRWRMYQSGNGECSFVPSVTPGGSDWDWNKAFRIKPDGTIKQAMDKDWTNLPTTGVENVADRILKYKRSGEQITVIGSVKNAVNTTIFATIPAGFRPVQNIAFPALAYGNVPTVCEVTVKSDGGIFVNGVQSGNTIHIAMNFLI
ncbi:BppU family phage baseplate upper protein [Bacillus paramycoides]|uniref:BppU family phage baseplate upper protein n=1 Tax=Bacillus paramycoides TaxID=2026194 RepID=UPI002E1BD3E3|nr:BppU family phage baseplate upper protein [Bacillus paramycoides]MED1462551.1 BppU family phage baseplate upper protein [Bacillus paramycoides]MED1494006.1 BppU family phage baseplate upper protein [Bacillus paramycoides]